MTRLTLSGGTFRNGTQIEDVIDNGDETFVRSIHRTITDRFAQRIGHRTTNNKITTENNDNNGIHVD
ncbi:hypothetical protein DERF_014277 [Dermatophagoides farinae]|uniref:Uncharacterized protein n=1 Tax=Dermatophagoides farinae TaxID=6954 RepID=A0A922HHC0_DERFA|nr:hypothetical protein DERF_014277 [Dermatophagoides farinae]